MTHVYRDGEPVWLRSNTCGDRPDVWVEAEVVNAEGHRYTDMRVVVTTPGHERHVFIPLAEVPLWVRPRPAREPLQATSALTFAALRTANTARIPLYKNAHGVPARTEDGSDWSVSDWYMATSGELGELGNVLKKCLRGDRTYEDARDDIADELADVQIYLDILASRLGVDLGAATERKFNRVSKAQALPIRLVAGCAFRETTLSRAGALAAARADGWYFQPVPAQWRRLVEEHPHEPIAYEQKTEDELVLAYGSVLRKEP